MGNFSSLLVLPYGRVVARKLASSVAVGHKILGSLMCAYVSTEKETLKV